MSGAQRQGRVRLAKQRPGPQRVRARRSTRVRRWWHRVDWGRVGTIAAIFFGIASVGLEVQLSKLVSYDVAALEFLDAAGVQWRRTDFELDPEHRARQDSPEQFHANGPPPVVKEATECGDASE